MATKNYNIEQGVNYLILLLVLLIVSCKTMNTKDDLNPDVDLQSEESSFVIAFGSCNHQDKPQPLWEHISNEKPDVWIWLGDNIYGDTESESVFRRKYDKAKSNEGYLRLRKDAKIIGTWDDHDYGVNDGDKLYPQRSMSRDLALEFLDVDKSSPVWDREGLYQSYVYQYDTLVIRILLLDTRYFKDPITPTIEGYVPVEDIELLGEVQWKWLETELSKDEDILIIANGTQIIPEDHNYEKWANYPDDRSRLLDALDQESTHNIILLSGDRHIGEISHYRLKEKTIYEVTSSGLTHSYESIGEETNRHRIGKLLSTLNYGVITINSDHKTIISLHNFEGNTHEEVKL